RQSWTEICGTLAVMSTPSIVDFTVDSMPDCGSNIASHTAPNPSDAMSRATVSTSSSSRAVDASRVVTPARSSKDPIPLRLYGTLAFLLHERADANCCSSGIHRRAQSLRCSPRRWRRATAVEHLAHGDHQRLRGERLLEIGNLGVWVADRIVV